MGNEINLEEKNSEKIINKNVLEKIFETKNIEYTLMLYLLYCDLAKKNKTNIIQANDLYVTKKLKWGNNKVAEIKKELKEKGLIKVIKKVNDTGRISGWYIEIIFLAENGEEKDCENCVCMDFNKILDCERDFLIKEIILLSEKNKSILYESKKMLEEIDNKNTQNKIKNEKKIKETQEMREKFEEVWKMYPRKRGKESAFKHFSRSIKEGAEISEIKRGISFFIEEQTKLGTIEKYFPHGSTFFCQKMWKDYCEAEDEEKNKMLNKQKLVNKQIKKIEEEQKQYKKEEDIKEEKLSEEQQLFELKVKYKINPDINAWKDADRFKKYDNKLVDEVFRKEN